MGVPQSRLTALLEAGTIAHSTLTNFLLQATNILHDSTPETEKIRLLHFLLLHSTEAATTIKHILEQEKRTQAAAKKAQIRRARYTITHEGTKARQFSIQKEIGTVVDTSASPEWIDDFDNEPNGGSLFTPDI